MMQLDTINWSVAILLSLLVHSMILMGSGAQIGAESATVLQAPLITRLIFNQPSTRAEPDKPLPVKKQQPRKQPEPVKKIEPKPVLAKPVKKKPIKKKPVKDNVVARQTEPVEKTEPVRQVASLEQVKGQQVSHSSDSLLQHERQQYLHKLLSHIESFKFYPRAARRRSLEGDVKISFMLLDDGYCEQLTLDGRHSALVNATQQALESAMPLPVPPKDIGLPRQIEFAMAYSLTQ